MVSLATVQKRFEIVLTLVEGGAGQFRGVVSEAPQSGQPNYVMTDPRKLLRVKDGVPIVPGQVVQTPGGEKLLVGENGASDSHEGILWRSFRLFLVTKQMVWTRRGRTVDPLTKLERDTAPVELGRPWVVFEPLDREINDSKLRRTFEQARFLVGANIQADDLLDDRVVSKVDSQLGLRIGVLT